MKKRKFLIAFPLALLLLFLLLLLLVWYADPFFHFHAPREELYYELSDKYQRSQNDGIVRNFDYEAIINGTSMTENFKASEAEELFGLDFIKTPFSGGSYKENKDNLRTALEAHPDIKLIIRGIDIGYFYSPRDRVRTDLGDYPTYLYDDNVFNDIKYFFNRYVAFESLKMGINALMGREGGITDFDEYSRWPTDQGGGSEYILRNRGSFGEAETEKGVSAEEKAELRANAWENIAQLAADYPDTEFYCFFTPYSIAYWGELRENGEITRQIEAERIFIEEMLKCENIKIFSYNTFTGLTAELENYTDKYHYREDINSQILRWMQAGEGLITRDNYEAYLSEEEDIYRNFDYSSLF